MRTVSLRRLLRQIWHGHTVARAFMNTELERVGPLGGAVLDVGAGDAPSYWRDLRLAPGSRLYTLDVNAAYRPRVVGNIEEGLPFRNGSLDAVLLMNVLEHIFNPRDAIRELGRILRPGGTFYVSTPFLVGVHTSTGNGIFVDDFFRYTRSSYCRLLTEERLFDQVDVAACGGLFTSVASLMQPVFRLRPLWLIGVAAAVLFDRLIARRYSFNNEKWVVSYFVTARRAAS